MSSAPDFESTRSLVFLAGHLFPILPINGDLRVNQLSEALRTRGSMQALCGSTFFPCHDDPLRFGDFECDECMQICAAIGQEPDAEVADCCADEGPVRPPYTERVHNQWGLRIESGKFILITRTCDEDGLDWQEHETPWTDVATFDRKYQAEKVLYALRSNNGS